MMMQSSSNLHTHTHNGRWIKLHTCRNSVETPWLKSMDPHRSFQAAPLVCLQFWAAFLLRFFFSHHLNPQFPFSHTCPHVSSIDCKKKFTQERQRYSISDSVVCIKFKILCLGTEWNGCRDCLEYYWHINQWMDVPIDTMHEIPIDLICRSIDNDGNVSDRFILSVGIYQ